MADKIDKILSIGSTPDWISPAISIFKDMTKGKRVDFEIPLDCGYSVNEVKRILRDAGIDCWGDMVDGDVFYISVPKRQAKKAGKIFNRYDI